MNDIVLKRFFTKSTIEGLVTGKSSDFVDCVVRRYIDEPDGRSYRELISEIYVHISKEYRMEYFYKNTLLNKLLFLRHDYKTTSVLTELPIGKAKADFIMINGRGEVYEIKTERDNLSRLNEQIGEYYKAFSLVNVVTYPENVERVIKLVPEYVGIIELTKHDAIKTVRRPKKFSDMLDAEVIFKILRKHEYEKLLLENGFNLPAVSQFAYYKECLNLMCLISVQKLQKQMLKELKKRVRIETVENCLKTQDELRFLTYFDKKKLMKEDVLNPVLSQRFGGK